MDPRQIDQRRSSKAELHSPLLLILALPGLAALLFAWLSFAAQPAAAQEQLVPPKDSLQIMAELPDRVHNAVVRTVTFLRQTARDGIDSLKRTVANAKSSVRKSAKNFASNVRSAMRSMQQRRQGLIAQRNQRMGVNRGRKK